jgi:hypothetical protein
MDKKVEEGIQRYIKYIRRMNSMSNEELLVVLLASYNQDNEDYIGMAIGGAGLEGHISHIREMGMLSDDKIRKWLRDAVYKDKDPVLSEVFESAAKQKSLLETKKMAKDLKGDPRKFARRVDREFSL